MVLSFTGTISVTSAGREEVREMLIGAIGCNLAWGIIDAVMYVMMVVGDRGRSLAVSRAVRESKDAEGGRRTLAEALPDPLGELIDGEALERARLKLVALPSLPSKPRMQGRDLKGALGVFLLVFLSTLPVVLPFLFVPDVHRALRISNGVALAMLFIVGRNLGRYAGLRPVLTGLVMVAVGLLLVGLTIALGG
jgi:VIT1/CCC1 family predicted Fe2+/Mn2+ transporter